MPALLRLERTIGSSTLAILASRRLLDAGFSHGFSTRRGGVSGPPFDSLDLASAHPDTGTDARPRLAENLRRFLGASGLSERVTVSVRQVHGRVVADGDCPQEGTEADALVSDDIRRCVLVRTADCVPILLACPSSGRVAAVHAGWRGLVADVIGAAVEALAERGSAPPGLLAAIGPSIGVDAYEVGEEVASEFAASGLDRCVRRRGAARPHVDCHGAARALLERAGVPPTSIDGEACCTFSDAGDFFSYRRDGAASGRMAAAIGPRG